jgi:hypothetical protein
MKIHHSVMSQQRHRVSVHFSQQIIIRLKRVTKSVAILQGCIIGRRHFKEHVDEQGGISMDKFAWSLVRHGLKEMEELGGVETHLCFHNTIYTISPMLCTISEPFNKDMYCVLVALHFKVQVHWAGNDQCHRAYLEFFFDQLIVRVGPAKLPN